VKPRRRRIAVGVLALALLAVLAGPAGASAGPPAAPIDASPLASNGFASPSCGSQVLTEQLSPNQRTNCAVSGVDVAPVPLSNYAIDINIPSGLDAGFGEDLDTVVQDLLVTPVWTALVWLVHVVLVALEWCYAIDLLAPSTLSRVSSSLGVAKGIFTDPWLGLALTIAAVGFAWQGLVRRRVLDTLGRAGLLVVMVCAGLWIIADPTGTVGAVGNLADRAALATVAASATGNPGEPVSRVDGAFAEVLDTVIGGPWCYLEFGDVDWCRQREQLDPRLHATATTLELELRAEASCRGPSTGLVQCAPDGSALQSQLAGAATALSEAQTNGELFLALPPDALARTALSSQTATPTLYGALCGSGDPTACTAATAPQAEFRTAPGTWPRVGGLLLIAAGTLGMLLLLGFIALRLLGAALATLLYLLLAPLAVLAPALGDAGRDAFRLWLTRLAGATLAKLVYSMALGIVLLIATLLSSLDGLGWWTQWLLNSIFWWTAFEQRHRLLSLVIHERGEQARRAPVAGRIRLAGRSAGAGLGAARASGRLAASAGGRAVEVVRRGRDFPAAGGTPGPPSRLRPRAGGAPGEAPQALSRNTRRRAARGELDAQVARVRGAAERNRSSSGGRAGDGSAAVGAAELAALEIRRARIAEAVLTATAQGDRRRVTSLRMRARHVDEQLAQRMPRPGSRGDGPGAAGGVSRSRLGRATAAVLAGAGETRAVARALDRAARERPGTYLRPGAAAAPLAALAGITPAEYLQRPPAGQRAARIEIERELARRRELTREHALIRRGRLRPPPAGDGPTARREADLAAPISRRARQFGSRSR